jgi:hypothetical protein
MMLLPQKKVQPYWISEYPYRDPYVLRKTPVQCSQSHYPHQSTLSEILQSDDLMYEAQLLTNIIALS